MLIKKIFVSSLLCISTLVLADNVSDLKGKLLSAYPTMKIESVEYIRSLNLYELKVQDVPNYAYTNSSVDFFIINGELVDPKTKENYTKNIGFSKLKDFFNKLPIDSAIKVKYGTGERKVAIFSDPDCPYCKALDKEIHSKLQNDNITVYYYMNPLQILGHENAPMKARKILCDPDPGVAWKNWMLNNVLPNNNGNCSNASKLDVSSKFAQNNGFQSSPIIIFDNGVTSMKVLTGEDIRAALNSRKP